MNQEICFEAMNTSIAAISRAHDNPSPWQKTIEDWFHHVERLASRFDQGSELSRLNRMAPERIVFIDPLLYEVIDHSLRYAIQTDFLFNPFVKSRMDAIGYDRSFNEIKETVRDNQHVTQNNMLPVSEDYFVLYPTIQAVEKKEQFEIDLGGIAKGWSVDKAADLMKQMGMNEGVVNAGGDMLIWGQEPELIGIAHPFDDDLDIAQALVTSGGVATSSKMYRRWLQGDVLRHHILDGKTGLPTESDVVQATAFAASAIEADVIAKVLTMLPFTEGMMWLEKTFPDAGCICVSAEGRLAINHQVQQYAKEVRLS